MCGRGEGAKYVVFFIGFYYSDFCLVTCLNKEILLCFFLPKVFQEW